MMGGLIGQHECTKLWEVDLIGDLEKFDVPTLIIHGDDDQIVPIEATAYRAARLVPDAILKVYPGGPHGLAVTHKDQLNADLLAFIRDTVAASKPFILASPNVA